MKFTAFMLCATQFMLVHSQAGGGDVRCKVFVATPADPSGQKTAHTRRAPAVVELFVNSQKYKAQLTIDCDVRFNWGQWPEGYNAWAEAV